MQVKNLPSLESVSPDFLFSIECVSIPSHGNLMVEITTGIQEIYCDEHGYSGNYLLDAQQPYFIYSSIAIDGIIAKETVTEIKKDFQVNSNELKGGRLLKYNKGRRAILKIIKSNFKNIKISVSDKKYALACKFVEYIFEPTVASQNSIFYAIGFHKFIAGILYLEFMARNETSEYIFDDFEKLMRKMDLESLGILFSPIAQPNMSPVLKDIRDFAFYNKGTIIKEIDSLKGTNHGKWVLDLSTSSLFALLGHWGERYEQLKVFCDTSKPIESGLDLFNVMINRKDKKYVQLGGEKHPLTFNLAEPISLVDSIEHAGIQLADVIAAAYGYAFKNRNDKYSKELIEFGSDIFGPGSIWPESERLNPSYIENRRNSLVLCELVDRSRRKCDLLDGMSDYIEFIHNNEIELNLGT